MEIKDKKKNIVVVAILIIVGLFILNYFNIFSQLPLTMSDRVIDSGTTDLPWECPVGASYCRVRGTMECNNPTTGEQKVIARVKNSLYGDRGVAYEPGSAHWIALDNPYTDYYDMESWVMTSLLSGTLRGCSKNYFDVPYGFTAFISDCEGKWRLYVPIPNEEDKWYYYTQKAGADLNPTPKYNCQNQEICSGYGLKYDCEGAFAMKNEKGIYLLKETLSYKSDTTPGADYYPSKNGWYTINQVGNSVEIWGGSYSYIEYQVLQKYETCVKSVCEGSTGYRECTINNTFGEFIPCNTASGEICLDTVDGAKCNPPFDRMAIRSSSAFAPNDPIKVTVDIFSRDVSSGTVTIEIREDSPTGKIVLEESSSMDFKSSIPKVFTFSQGIPYVGEFFVVLQITSNEIPLPIIYGEDEGEKTSFRVSYQIVAELKQPYQKLCGVPVSLQGFTGYPTYIELLVTDLQGKPMGPDTIFIDATLGDKIVTLQKYSEELGRYVWTYTPQEPKEFKVTAHTIKGFYETKPDTERLPISQDAIEIKLIDFVSSVETGKTQSYKFETRNKDCVLIDTINKITVNKKGIEEDITGSLGRDSTGTYSFSYIFTEKGDYDFVINSQHSILLGSQKSSPKINVADVIVPGCKADEECGFLKRCTDTKCVYKVDVLLVIGVAIIILIAIIVIAIKFIKTKREPSFGF